MHTYIQPKWVSTQSHYSGDVRISPLLWTHENAAHPERATTSRVPSSLELHWRSHETSRTPSNNIFMRHDTVHPYIQRKSMQSHHRHCNNVTWHRASHVIFKFKHTPISTYLLFVKCQRRSSIHSMKINAEPSSPLQCIRTVNACVRLRSHTAYIAT